MNPQRQSYSSFPIVGVPIRRRGESIADYSPFGVVPIAIGMDGRTVSLDIYRYSFQNQEEDSETGLVNYKYRMHDPRIGRFFAVDLLAVEYPHNSPYAFSENRVIDGIELEGLEYYPAGKSIIKAVSAIGYKPDYKIDLNKLSDVTKQAFVDAYNTLIFSNQGPVISLKVIRKSDIDLMVKNYFILKSLHGNSEKIRVFKEKNSLPQNEKQIEDAIRLFARAGGGYSGLAKVKLDYKKNGYMNGFIALMDLVSGIKEQVDMNNLSKDCSKILENFENFNDALELAEIGVRNSSIIDKKWIKEQSMDENTIPKSPNMQLKTDLVNYILDGTLPKNKSKSYIKMIKKAGTEL